jgi:hypothetical protein
MIVSSGAQVRRYDLEQAFGIGEALNVLRHA